MVATFINSEIGILTLAKKFTTFSKNEYTTINSPISKVCVLECQLIN